MSVCYNINCHACKESLWIGQRDYIYTTKEALSDLNIFLFKHEGHELSFNSDNEFEFYKEVNGFDGRDS